MANRQNQRRRQPGNGRRERPAAAAPVFPDFTRLLPRQWRRSPAWKHFRAAQVEFLTGMQVLLNDCLERMKISEESQRELRRIEVEE